VVAVQLRLLGDQVIARETTMECTSAARRRTVGAAGVLCGGDGLKLGSLVGLGEEMPLG
jgi:hypothetical protein